MLGASTTLGQNLEVRIRVGLHRLGVPNVQAARKVLARVETGCDSRWRQCACSSSAGDMSMKLLHSCKTEQPWYSLQNSMSLVSKVQSMSSACTGKCNLPDQCHLST